MACREVEMGKKKCEKYWPVVHHSVQHGAISITTVTMGIDTFTCMYMHMMLDLVCQFRTRSPKQVAGGREFSRTVLITSNIKIGGKGFLFSSWMYYEVQVNLTGRGED